MGWEQSALQYRKAAFYSATPIGTIIMLYDQLAKDLRQAANALREKKFENCASEVKHAFTVLAHLDSYVDQQADDPAVPWLLRFYKMLRANVLDAQIKASAEQLDAQAQLVIDVRGAWQELESRLQMQALEPPSATPVSAASDGEAVQSSWSA